MSVVPIARAKHVQAFVGRLREIGSPVDRELARARLPAFLEEMTDGYVSEILVFRFLMRSAALEGIDDLGFEATWGMGIEQLGPVFLDAARATPTVKARLDLFARFASLEANILRSGFRREGDSVRVSCWRVDDPRDVDIRLAEWQQLNALIAIVRSGTGPRWLPTEICFRSDFKPCPAVLHGLGNTRIRTGQPATSILVPAAVLAMPIARVGAADRIGDRGSQAAPNGNGKSEPGEGIIEALQKALGPYLAERYPSIDIAAEIAGTSVRSLQRRLKQHQTSYSELIEGVRFETASRLLDDRDLKIIDVAMSVGYDDASHFSRAFRRVSGMSPREFRVRACRAATSAERSFGADRAVFIAAAQHRP